jgi:hypothetical protein
MSEHNIQLVISRLERAIDNATSNNGETHEQFNALLAASSEALGALKTAPIIDPKDLAQIVASAGWIPDHWREK